MHKTQGKKSYLSKFPAFGTAPPPRRLHPMPPSPFSPEPGMLLVKPPGRAAEGIYLR
jgi:hypothetical protein